MTLVLKPDDPGHISLNVGPLRKRAMRKLMVELEFDDLTNLLIALMDDEIAKRLPAEFAEIRRADPKVESRRQALKKAA